MTDKSILDFFNKNRNWFNEPIYNKAIDHQLAVTEEALEYENDPADERWQNYCQAKRVFFLWNDGETPAQLKRDFISIGQYVN